MKIGRYLLATMIGTLLAVPVASPSLAQTVVPVAMGGDCAALKSFDFTQYPDAPTTLDTVELVAASDELPEYCRIVGSIGPGDVNFELRLPTKTWNGRLLTQGSGGSGGAVNIDECEDVLARDYVTVATDMGHANTDEFWTKDLQQLLDFSFRAVHVTTATAKELTEAFYGQKQNYAYFRGCSSGGRAAMVSAQRFPGDFDGIIAGAVGTPRAKSYFIPTWIIQSNIDADGKSIITQAELPKVSKAVLEACGSGEAKTLGFLEDPRSCDFDPQSIICPDANVTDTCITAAQAGFLQKVYDGPRNSKGGLVYVGGEPLLGLSKGSETEWDDWVAKDSDPASAPSYASRQAWFQEQAFLMTEVNRDFKITDVNFDTDPNRVNAVEYLWTASSPDYSAIRQQGVKVIHFSGWNDNRTPGQKVVDNYELATRVAGGADEMRDFYRLFLIPGMGHCGGGTGPETFDWLTSLENWVEKGEAPETIVGEKFDDNGQLKFEWPVNAFVPGA